jgi:hypothetical protein
MHVMLLPEIVMTGLDRMQRKLEFGEPGNDLDKERS